MVTAMRYPHIAHSSGYKGKIGKLTWVATEYYIQIYLDDILLLTFSKEHMVEVISAL